MTADVRGQRTAGFSKTLDRGPWVARTSTDHGPRASRNRMTADRGQFLGLRYAGKAPHGVRAMDALCASAGLPDHVFIDNRSVDKACSFK